MTARDEILARIQAAAAPPGPPPARAYQRADALNADDTKEKFIARITDYGVTVRRIAGAGQIASAVAAICAERGVERLAVPLASPAAWRPATIAVIPDFLLPINELAGCDAALTTAACAIAETGTLVLDGGPTQGRRALSLLPDLHICVLFADQIVECVPSALARLAPSAQAGRPLTFISGPSATADIEFDRVQGVHGPRQLEVILVVATDE